MAVYYNTGRIITDGLVLALDAGNTKSYPVRNFVSAKIYSVFNSSLRSSNYTVQYSDDNSNWTTAFSGVASNNTSCGIQQNTGSGNGSYGFHRYWRYVEGSAVTLHHPRVSRIILTDINGSDYNLVVYTSDNCSDSGTYVVGTVSSDFGGTTWTDLLGTGNNGTLTNGPTYSSANGGSIVFDGTNDYVSASNTSLVHRTSNWSYSCWVNFNGTPSLGTIFENGSWTSCLLIRFETNGISIYSMSSYWGKFTLTPTLNTWYKLDFIRNGNSIDFYLNGTYSQSLSFTADIQPSSNLFIGMSQHSAGQCFNGRIAQTQIYNRALTASEIQQNFNALRGRFGI